MNKTQTTTKYPTITEIAKKLKVNSNWLVEFLIDKKMIYKDKATNALCPCEKSISNGFLATEVRKTGNYAKNYSNRYGNAKSSDIYNVINKISIRHQLVITTKGFAHIKELIKNSKSGENEIKEEQSGQMTWL